MILKIFLLRLLFVECRTIVRMDKLRQNRRLGVTRRRIRGRREVKFVHSIFIKIICAKYLTNSSWLCILYKYDCFSVKDTQKTYSF